MVLFTTEVVKKWQTDLNGNEDDNHPLQSKTVLLTQVVPHEISKLCAVLQLLIHNLKQKHEKSVKTQ